MPVRDLATWLKENEVNRLDNLRILDGTRVGVEGFFFVRQFVVPQLKEPIETVVGGRHPSLSAIVAQRVEQFRRRNIEPVIVFQGLPSLRKTPPPQGGKKQNMKQQTTVADAWDLYEMGKIDDAKEVFQRTVPTITLPFINQVFGELNKLGVQAMRALYGSLPQLVYFEKNHFIHGIIAPVDAILYGGRRVISSVDFEKDTMDWVDSDDAVDVAGLRDVDALADACVLSGMEFLQTFPPLLDGPRFNFQIACDELAEKTAVELVQEHSDHYKVKKMGYVQQFETVYNLTRYAEVVAAGGTCETLSTPPENYSFPLIAPTADVIAKIATGQVNTQLLGAVSSGILTEAAPAVDTAQYRRLVTSPWSDDIRSLALECARKYAFPSMMGDADPVVVETAHGTNHPTSSKLSFDKLEGTFTGEVHPKLGSSLWSDALHVLVRGSAFSTAFDKVISSCDSGHVHSMVLALKLLGMDMLSGAPLEHVPKLPKSASAHISQREIDLVSRTCTVLPATINGPYEGPLDRDAVAYFEIVRSVRRTISNLLEALWLRSKAVSSSTDECPPSLPEPSCVVGIVVKKFLEGTAVDELKRDFGAFVDVPSVLQQGMAFWESVCKAVSSLNGDNVLSDEVVREFELANTFVKGFNLNPQ